MFRRMIALVFALASITVTAACGSSGNDAGPLPAPAGVSATAGDAEVVVNWNAVDGADSYTIYWSPEPGIAAALSLAAATPTAIQGIAAPYSHTGLTNGSVYYYTVAAVNGAGEGEFSEEVTAVPQLGLPAAPSGLTITAANKHLTINWTAVNGASSYKVYWNTTAGIDTNAPHAESATTATLEHAGISNLSTYYYRVAAINATGEGPLSEEASARPVFGGDEVQLIENALAVMDDQFGYAVALDADTAIVGARHYNANKGSAFVYRYANGTWSLETELAPPGVLVTNGTYGESVAISGDRAVVGNPTGNGGVNNSGVAVVFKRTGASWSVEKMLSASDAAAGDRFGASVAVSSTFVAIGAPTEDNSGLTNNGSVYHWAISNLNAGNKLLFGAADSDQYGYSVALSNNTLFIGAPLNNGRGIAHMVSLNPLQSVAFLTANNAAANDRYGDSVSIDGEAALVGMPGNPATMAGAVAALRLENGVWTEEQRLVPSQTSVGDQFGTAVSISGDYAIVGAPLDDKVNSPGAVFVFRHNGTEWREEAMLRASDSTTGDQFGWSVGIDGERLIIGAYLSDRTGAVDAGAVYFY